jgi:hypothetical protein
MMQPCVLRKGPLSLRAPDRSLRLVEGLAMTIGGDAPTDVFLTSLEEYLQGLGYLKL